MRIEKVESYPVRIPGFPYMGGHDERQSEVSDGPYVDHKLYRSVFPRNAESYLVKITTDDGIVGWGETQAAIMPQVVARLVDELLVPRLLGTDPRDRVVLRDRMYNIMRDRGHDAGYLNDAIAACDIALWDIIGKAAGQPIYKLLGGSYRDSIPCYVSGVPAGSAEEQIERMREWVEKGFHAFKISLGFGVDEDIAHIGKLRQAFGDKVEILVDIHWFYSFSDALRLGRGMEALRVGFMECPMTFEEIGNHTELCRKLDIPIALGEEFRTHYHFKERLERRALNLAQPDIGRLGITEGYRVTTLCHAFGVPSAPHIGSGLAQYTASALHIAAVTENLFMLEFQPTQIRVSDQYFTPSLRPVEGRYALPTEPGLGVAPIEEKIAEHVLQ